MVASSPVLPWAPPLASGWACAGFTVVCAVDTPHDGPSMGGLPVWTARSRRTHQRNDLAHGRDAPDVLREHGTFPISSGSASAQQPSGRGSQGRAAGVRLKSVQHRRQDHRQLPGQAARLKPSRFLNASCAARSRRARASASPWRSQRVGSAVAPPRDVSLIIDLARLVAPRRHPGADIA
jgi:hypothetical protein